MLTKKAGDVSPGDLIMMSRTQGTFSRTVWDDAGSGPGIGTFYDNATIGFIERVERLNSSCINLYGIFCNGPCATVPGGHGHIVAFSDESFSVISEGE